MEYPVSQQMIQLAGSIAFGAALGLHYDLLRLLRRWKHALTIALDLWFGLTSLLACCLFALYVGDGWFHLFMILGTLGGSILYFLTLSPWVLRLLRHCARCIGRLFRILLQPMKKIYLIAKKGFSFFQKSGTSSGV